MANTLSRDLPGFKSNTLQVVSDFKRSYLFQVILPPIGGSTDDALISYFISKTATPTMTTEEIKVPWMSSEIKVGGRTTFGDWTVTVRDDKKNIVFNYFWEWRQMLYGPDTGVSKYAIDYKQNVKVALLDSSNRDKIIQTFKLRGAFPTEVGQATLDYGQNEIITFDVKFAFDDFKVE